MRRDGPTDSRFDSVHAWVIATAALGVITVAFGAPYISVVALKEIAVDIGGGARSAPALAYALSSVGAAVGGLLFGWLTDRIGILYPLIFGSLMLVAGTALSGLGTEWSLYVGHGLMIGLLGSAALYSPVVTYVSRWFFRRRGLALSLVASGQQVSGAVWPPVFSAVIDRVGWQATFLYFALLSFALLVPMLALLRHPPPSAEVITAHGQLLPMREDPLHNYFFFVICAASVCCCVAMAMPMGHLVAFCGDLGYSQTQGANMLALLLGCGFISRLLWGRLSDLIGGINTALLSLICQALVLSLFLATQDLTHLYLVSAAFGLGFGGIIPSYVLAVREICPAREAGRRISTLLFFSLTGMALGGWLAGVIFDLTLDYRISFAAGIGFNAVAILLIGGLALIQRGFGRVIST